MVFKLPLEPQHTLGIALVTMKSESKETIRTLYFEDKAGTKPIIPVSSNYLIISSTKDFILPGKLPANEQAQFEQKVGYQDSLAIMSEPYRLWAIETSSKKTASILSFAAADTRVILAPSINKYKEIKLRLLNATHSLCCGVAYLSGFETHQICGRPKRHLGVCVVSTNLQLHRGRD